jgi:glycoprotein-N-acetylgalactosamine 3-beta-galactosyltransferase
MSKRGGGSVPQHYYSREEGGDSNMMSPRTTRTPVVSFCKGFRIRTRISVLAIVVLIGCNAWMFLFDDSYSSGGFGDDPIIVVSNNVDNDAEEEKQKPTTNNVSHYSCDFDYEGSREVLDSIGVANDSPTPKVLCFIMAHSGSHDTKVKAVWDTWGKKCDKLVIASNVDDPSIGAVKLQTASTYNNLWNKLNETLHYVWDMQDRDEYDWFFKADDDTFVIMENLKLLLSQPKYVVNEKNDDKRPLAFGYVLHDSTWGSQKQRLSSPGNEAFGRHFFNQVRTERDKVEYFAGGAGYVMNAAYLQELLHALRGNLTIRGSAPEDMAHGATMLARGISSQNSRDKMGRERFHQESPALTYVRHQSHLKNGVEPQGSKCCSRSTVSFHHIAPDYMRYMYDQFYHCRTND